MLKILIFGGRGWIGGMIVKLLSLEHNIIISDLRLDDTAAVKLQLEEIKPDRVISAVGRTHGPGCNTIDYLESKDKLKENVADNLYAHISLAILCQELNIHLTYLGTGCIFSYELDKNIFKETDEPNFFGSSYSVVKGFTDRLIKMFPKTLNIRLRMPISSVHNPRNLIDKLVNYKNICSIPNSMTVLDDLLPVLIRAITQGDVGTLNLVNPGVITHEEILEMYKKYINPDHEYRLMTLEEQRAMLKSDRSNNHLDTTLLEKNYGPIPHIKDSIENILKIMAAK